MVQETVGWTAHPRMTAAGGDRSLPVLAFATAAAPRLPPRIYVPRGPACDPGDEPAWAAAIATLEELAVEIGAASITVEPPCTLDDTVELRRRLSVDRWEPVVAVQPAHTTVVDLGGGEDAVLARMRPKGRYNARLAQRRGVRAAVVDDPTEAAAVLGMLCAATAARQGITQPDARYLRTLLDSLPASRVFIASVEGEPVSGALVARLGPEAIYLYGGSLDVHRELQPTALLHLEVIRHLVATGCERYDLWGIPPSADPGHPWHGLRQFKLALGGVEQTSAGGFRRVLRPVAARAAELAEAGRTTLRRLRHNRGRPRQGSGS